MRYGSLRECAFVFSLPERPVALPFVSRVIEVSVLWNFHRLACFFDPQVPTITFPAGSVGIFREISVGRHFDGDAFLFYCPVSTITLPARSTRKSRKVSVGRHFNENAGLFIFPETTVAFPSIAG